jgi:hypothetical protein
MRQDHDCTIASYVIPDVPEDYNSWEMQIDVPEVFAELEDLVSKADIIITQAVHTQKAIAFLYAVRDKYKVPFYADIDDDPYSLSSQHPSYDKMAPGSQAELWMDDLVKFVDGIFASTEYLKDRLLPYNPNVIVIPNGIDIEVWDEVKVKKHPAYLKDRINIGWVGGGNHFEDLELIERPIKEILKKHNHARFTIAIGNEIPFYFRNNKHIIAFDFKSWVDIDRYPSFIKSLHIDIGLAPLRDNFHNRAKSNLKWLEFSAMKVPMIGSDVEPYKKTTALIAKTEEDWFNHIDNMILSEQARTQLGIDSYNNLKDNFNTKDLSATFLDTIKKIIKESKK